MRRLLLSVALMALTASPMDASRRAESVQVDEPALKAAYLRNFLSFATWPAAKSTAAVPAICVLGGSAVTPRLAALAGTATQRKFRVVTATSTAELEACHIVFVPSSEAARVAEVTERWPGRGLLVVTEDQVVPAAAITLLMDGSTLAFEVDLAAAAAQQVPLSSKLVKLAKRVMGGGSELMNGRGGVR